jgi:hypothetical protein
VRQFRALLVLTALLGIGLVLRVAEDAGVGMGALPMMHGFAAWFVPLLGAFELRRITRTLAFVGRRRQLRGEYRTPLAAAAVIVPVGALLDDEPSLLGRMCDITTGGVGFELSRPLSPGTHVDLTVQLPDVAGEPFPTRLEVKVRSCMAHGQEWRVGAAIVGCEESDRRRVLSYCNVVWPYRRLRGETELAAAPAAPSLEHGSSVRAHEAKLA